MLLSTCLTTLTTIPAITAQFTTLSTSQVSDVTPSSGLIVLSSSVPGAISSSTTVQDVSSTTTSCSTHFIYVTTPTGSSSVPVPTTFFPPITTTKYFEVTTTTRDTISVTPSATTFTDTVITTTTLTTTTTSIPPTVVVPTSPGFFPLIAAETNVARVKRLEIGGPKALTPGFSKRQLNSGGFSVDEEGVPSDATFKKTTGYECQVIVSVNRTTTTIVTDPPETVILAPQVATSVVTSTVSTTETVTTVLPTPTTYAACGNNNVVDQVRQWNGRILYFTSIVFDGENGLPDTQIVLVPKTSGVGCCIECQLTRNCAASAWLPSRSQCRILLTEAPAAASNNTAVIDSTTFITPTASAVAPISTGGSMAPAIVHSNSTCARGSASKYVGEIQGRENFNPNYAIEFSNGPCGRLDLWPVPLTNKMALI